MTDVAAPRRKLDLARVFSDTFAVIRRQAPILLGLTLTFYLLPTLASSFVNRSVVLGRATPAQALERLGSPVYWLTLVLSMLLGTFALACQLNVAIRDLDGQPPALREVLALALRKALPLFAATILFVLGLWVGMIFLFVPGVILGVMWIVTMPVVVDDTSNVFRAFGKSRALTRGNRWRIFGLLLIVMVLLLIAEGVLVATFGSLAALASGGTTIGGMIIFGVLGLVVSLGLSVGSAALYVQLRELKGQGGESVAQVFA